MIIGKLLFPSVNDVVYQNVFDHVNCVKKIFSSLNSNLHLIPVNDVNYLNWWIMMLY